MRQGNRVLLRGRLHIEPASGTVPTAGPCIALNVSKTPSASLHVPGRQLSPAHFHGDAHHAADHASRGNENRLCGKRSAVQPGRSRPPSIFHVVESVLSESHTEKWQRRQNQCRPRSRLAATISSPLSQLPPGHSDLSEPSESTDYGKT